MRLIFFIIISLSMLCSERSLAYTATDSLAPSPKVGLVLSGGAAHGFAHIGVIKYLEEQNIPIDYITGTSMGAVVGALYAMGYSADEILNIATKQEWNAIISNSVPIRDVIITEKNEHQKIPYYIIWNGDSFDLPRGFLAGQKMDLILNRIYSPAHFVNDFDSLPIPFRCVAIDIAEGRIHNFSSGYLGQSVRASMAIPSIFPPVEIDKHLYVDGGLIRNFPVQENIDMGADFIIGSYVGSKRKPKDELKSLVDILRQSTSMMNMLDSEEQQELVDVLIAPDLEKYSYFEFDEIDLFYKLGYEEAKKKYAGLTGILDSIEHISDSKPIEKLQTPELIKITKLVFHTNDKVVQEMIKGKLGFEVGEEVSLNTIEDGISDVFGLNYFEKVSYDFFPYEDGIGLELASVPSTPIKLGLSFNRFHHYSPSLIFNAELRNVLGKPTRLHSSTRISSNPGSDLIFQYRFWKDPDWLLQTRFMIESFLLPFFTERELDRTYRQWSGHASLKFLKEIHKNSYFGFGYAYNYHRINPQIVKNVDISKLKVKLHSYTFEYAYNSSNSQSFPTDGWNIKFNASHDFIVNQSLSQKPESEFLAEIPDNNNVSVSLLVESYNLLSETISWHNWLSLAYNSDEIFLENYRLGGPNVNKNSTRGLIGINDSELIVGSHVLLGSKFQIQLNDYLFLNPVINFLYADDYLKYAYGVEERIKLVSGGFEIAFKTPIGPMFFDVGFSNLGERMTTNLSVGYRHIL